MAFHTPDGWRDVTPGTVIFMPRAVPHTFRNRGAAPSQHWVLTAPSGFEEFYARSAALFARQGPPDVESLRRSAADHAMRFSDPHHLSCAEHGLTSACCRRGSKRGGPPQQKRDPLGSGIQLFSMHLPA
jgi:hypothetical protein